LPGFDEVPYTRVWTVLLIVLGSGTLLYFISTLTAFIVEGDLGGALRRNRMRQSLTKLVGHTIVCGAGTTGIHVIEELIHTHTPFCVSTPTSIASRSSPSASVPTSSTRVGDAADDEVLHAAGVERRRVVAAPTRTSGQLVTVTVAALNPKIRTCPRPSR
jgi:voltage-gated potassium channel